MAVDVSLVTKETHLAEAGFPPLPTGWEVRVVGDLLSEDRGISVGVMYPGEHDPSGVPLIRVGDLAGSCINPHPEYHISPAVHHEYRRTALTGGELLLTLVGGLGQCAIVPKHMAGWNAARAVAVLRLIDPGDAPFVRYCLLSHPLQHLMQVWATTTVQATLNLKEIKQLPLPWPSPQIRSQIADVLGDLDAKIELNRRMNETLEAMARAIFRSWFVDFDPVRAKVEGRKPATTSHGAVPTFPSKMIKSELGPIPEGWRVGTVGEVADNPRRGIDPSQITSGTPYIALEHMPRRCIALGDWENADSVESNKFQFKRGEILFGKLRPYFHKVGVAPVAGVCSTDVLVVTPRTEGWFGFVLGHVSSDDFVAYTDRSSAGTKMPRTNWSDMAKYPVVLPPDGVASAYTDLIRPLIEKIVANVHESRTLASIRDLLLPRLLSGGLPVSAPRKHVPEGVT